MVGTDSGPLIEEYDASWRAPDTITAAEAFQPVIPVMRVRRRADWAVVLGVVFLVAVGLGGYLLASGGGRPSPVTPAAASHPAAGRTGARPAPPSGPSASRAALSPAAGRRAAPGPGAPVQSLIPVSIAAFGPGGTSKGDGPQLAPLALDGNAATPWHSDWYATAQFGNLQTGTGLLLDMGRAVTVTRVQIAMGGAPGADLPGADLELRIGGTPTLAGLPTAAYATGVGGTVRLQLSAAAHGRYVLVWFTRLPPDQAGTFQASVYSIQLQGHP